MANTENLHKIFENMDVGTNAENTNNAKTWLQNKNFLSSMDDQATTDKIDISDATTGEKLATLVKPSEETLNKLLNLPNKLTELGGLKQEQLLLKLGGLIEKSTNEIVEIEIVARGLLAKETKQAISLLVDCLKYYSNWAVYKPEYLNAKGSYCAVLSDSTYLGSLGWIFGPALATGYNLILQTSNKFSIVASYIAELIVKAGYPENAIQVIPGDVETNILNNENVKVVSIFDNIYSEKYEKLPPVARKTFCNVLDGKIPMIVFNSADLDSACNSAIDAVWNYQGQLPWSVDTILVQEDVLEEFVGKLKHKIENLNIGHGNDKVADISFPVKDNAADKLRQIIRDAAMQGITVYQAKPNCDQFQPMLLIGGQVYGNNVLTEDKIDIPFATVLGFRTASEAVNLANNRRGGLAASVWTENIGLSNEVCKKLNVGTIWVNGHGILSAECPMTPIKASGIGYFGGKQGLYQLPKNGYPHVKLTTAPQDKEDSTANAPTGKDFQATVLTAKKGLAEWQKLSMNHRVQCLIKLSNELESAKDSLSKKVLPEWINNWIDILRKPCIPENFCSEISNKSYEVKTTYKPLGVVAMETRYAYSLYPMNYIVSALVYGNSVVLLNNDSACVNFWDEFCKMLPACKIPAGVVNVIHKNNPNLRKAAVVHKEIGKYIALMDNCSFADIPLADRQKLYIVNNNVSMQDAVDAVTYVKNVWSNSGQSFL